MKKLLIAGNIIFLSILLFQACENKPVLGVNCYYQAYDNNKFNGVDIDLVKDMMKNYDENHYSQITINGRPMSDSRSVWFSLKRLKQFIYLAESRACEKGCTNSDALGVRIYFTEYTKDKDKWDRFRLTEDHNLPKDYMGLHTLLMIPTIWDGEYNSDFDPFRIDTVCKAGCFANILDTISKEKEGGNLRKVVALMPDETQDADNPSNTNMNNGSLVPPPYPPTDFKITGKISYPSSGAKLLMWTYGIGCNTKRNDDEIPPPPPPSNK